MEAVLNGPNGRIVLGPTPLTIGRTPDNQLVVNDAKSSSHHAEIRTDGQSYSITDLGSTNGTFVNGQRLERGVPRQLSSGDVIRIGDTPYTYEANAGSGSQYESTMYASPGQMQGQRPAQGSSSYDPTIAASGQQPPSPSTAYGANAMQGYQSSSPDFPQYNQGNQPTYPAASSGGYPPPPSPNPAYGQPSYTPPPPPSYPPAFNQADQMAYPPPPPVNQSMTPGGGLPSYGVPPQAPQQPKRRSTGLVVLIVVIVLLLIVGSVGFLVIRNNQIATNNTNATATANTNTSNAHATATGQVVATQTGVASTHATATATIVSGNPNPYPPNTGTLALYDTLKDNTGGYKWDEGNGCAFTGGSYHVTEATTGKFTYCVAGSSNYSNFAYRVEMTIVKGDCGGMVFRADANNNFYDYEVCQDGTFYLASYTAGSGKYLIQPKSDASILKGMNQDNLIAVVAQGGSMTFYINNHNVGSTNDSSFTSGQVGVLADAVNTSTDVSYAFAKAWTL